MSETKDKGCMARGLLAGALGGLVASWVMNRFIAAAREVEKTIKSPEQKAQEESQPASEDSTVKVADTVTWLVTGRRLTPEGKQKGGPIVHYAFGTLMGTLYGALAALSENARAGAGSAFGTALFVAADEVMVPALGLAQPPTEQPASDQLTHLAAHIVYGATVELVRRNVA